MKLSQTKENILKVILSFLCMCFIIYIGSTLFKRAKVDFTEEGLYTLSPGTKSLIGKMSTPVKLKLYYSKTAANKGTEGLRHFNNHFNYVRELLQEFVAVAKKKLVLDVIDPRPDTSEEEDALAHGLRKFHLSETESYFFGLVAENESGGEQIIEFFDPGQSDKLEYDLAKLIYQAQNPKKKTVGILSSLAIMTENLNPYMAQIMRMQGQPVDDSWMVTKLVQDLYNLQKIENEVDEIVGVDILAIIHPKELPEKTLFAIDQYLMKGGNLLVFVDPYAVIDQVHGGPYGGEKSASPGPGFKKLMDKWGIELAKDEFVGDKYLSGIGRPGPGAPPTRILGLLQCNRECSKDAQEPLVAGLDQLTFVFPGKLEVKKKEGIAATAFLQTTDKGNEYKASGFELDNAQRLWDRFSEGIAPVPLAYKLVGKFASAFPEGIQSEKKEKSEEKQEVLKQAEKEAAIIVYPDVDFIGDQFAFKRSFLGLAMANNNSTLFLNSIEALSGDVDLMSIRSKGSIDRSFDVIDQIEFQAEKKTAQKVSQINGSIAKFQEELNQLGQKANEGNIAILQNEGLQKKKELSRKIGLLKKELREVKREGREKVEVIGKRLQYLNTLFVPILVVLFGWWYAKRRKLFLYPKKAKELEEGGSNKLQAVGGEA